MDMVTMATNMEDTLVTTTVVLDTQMVTEPSVISKNCGYTEIPASSNNNYDKQSFCF